LTGCITVWYDNSTTFNRIALQRVVRTAQHITGAEVPAIQDLYIRQCERKARKGHPSHRLLSLLLHGKRYRCIKSNAKWLLNSFCPQQ
jgi:hypothetical protein